MLHKILVRRPQIWIPEIEYYQNMSSHAQIESQGAEKQQSKVNVVVVGGGGGMRGFSRQIDFVDLVKNTLLLLSNLPPRGQSRS